MRGGMRAQVQLPCQTKNLEAASQRLVEGLSPDRATVLEARTVLWCLGAAAMLLIPATGGADSATVSPSAGTVARPSPCVQPEPATLDRAIRRGIDFLLAAQNANGSWGSARRTKGLNIFAPVPGAHHAFLAGTSSLALAALIETGGQEPGVQAAIDRGEHWLFENLPSLRRATPVAIYNVWGHAYGIQALVRMHARHQGDETQQQQIRRLIKQQIDMLRRYESVDGGWGYYDFAIGAQRPATSSISFVNGTVLVAFHEAAALGLDAPKPVVERALAATRRQRKPDFSYLYGEYLKWRPMRAVNRPGGSLGRSQCCNLALRLWGDEKVTDDVLQNWLNRLIVRNGWLSIGRKRPIPHEAWFQVAAYFYYYGHYYAARCIEQLPVSARPFYQDHLATVLLPLQEKDGSWWDFPFYDYHQAYGTAFALMTLHRCQRPAGK